MKNNKKEGFKQKREKLIRELKSEGITDKKVLEVTSKVPRHLFVREEDIEYSYANHPLQILRGQTISQPYTVAFMLEALKLKKGQKVLEVGTCSGYNAVLISQLVGEKGEVYTIEIIPELVEIAKKNLKKVKNKTRLKVDNIHIIGGDGSKGYEKGAPYDRIIATAACPSIPPPFTEQLKENGIIVTPVGSRFSQRMMRARKIGSKVIEENLGGFIFVPLVGKYGY